MVILLAPEPLSFTSEWDPQWQVTRASGTIVFLRYQQSGKIKKVHRSKIRLVDSEMVWDELAPQPRRKQQRGDPPGVTVNVNVDPPQAILQPPCGDLQFMENPRSSVPSQASEPNVPMDTEPEEYELEHPLRLNASEPTPEIAWDVTGKLARARPIRGHLPVRRKTECDPAHGQKRAHSPPPAIHSRCNTRWSSLSEEEKRTKRVHYDVLAGRTSRFAHICNIYTVA